MRNTFTRHGLAAALATTLAPALAAALMACTLTSPAIAHHGKDFLLTETDDMPLPGHIYATLSVDTNVDKDGSRSTEITPGALFSVGDRVTLEPHFHVTKTADQDFHYDATAMEGRYNFGYLPKSEVRFAIAAEYEKPKTSDENSNVLARLIFVRSFPTSLVAVNLSTQKDTVSDGQRTYGLGLGFLKPLANGDAAGVEVAASLPFTDGVEVLPGYYHRVNATATVKIGVGVFHSNEATAGTVHLQFIQRL